jgi:hypothetical protein
MTAGADRESIDAAASDTTSLASDGWRDPGRARAGGAADVWVTSAIASQGLDIRRASCGDGTPRRIVCDVAAYAISALGKQVVWSVGRLAATSYRRCPALRPPVTARPASVPSDADYVPCTSMSAV